VDLTQQAALFVLQVGVVLIAAKVGGEIFERFLRQPAVLGELFMGVAIGPYALGAIDVPGIGHLFGTAAAAGGIPIPVPLWVFAELGAVVLLFVAGLETDFETFVRFGPTATVVAIGGVILPFIFGDVMTVVLGLAPSLASPAALFVGAALTATSVGVTARVLGDIGGLDTPEGITILGAAVFDDVIGILVLAVVVAIAQSGGVDVAQVGLIGGKALVAYLALTAILVIAATRIARVVNAFRSAGSGVALARAGGVVSGYIAQSVGLAMIVGAFSAGIALSRSNLRARLGHDMRAISHIVVPAFFVVVGMLVDLPALGSVIVFGSIITVLAIVGKVIGCALPALLLGFRPIGALRVGIGMIPRGEVALIIAGIGLATGAVDQAVFGVVVFMTFATTVLAPPLLVPIFRTGGRGFGAEVNTATAGLSFDLTLPKDLLDQLSRHLLAALAARGFEVIGSSAEGHFVELRRATQLLAIVTHIEGPGVRRIHVESESAVPDWSEALSAASTAAREELDRVLGVATAPRDGAR
jgi:Kef-type K+ transport system membrane component KefB